MGTTTTTFTLNKPTVGGDDNAWGTDWNTNADKLDDLLDGTTAIKPNLSEGLWKVGGVAVTSTAAELNILDGVTSTAAELNLIDGSVAGTIVNSKAVVYGAAGEVNATTLQIAGVSVTSTAAELNILDGVTSTAAELNVLDGIAGIASQAEAEAGTATDKLMTPERAKQAIDAQVPAQITTARVLAATAGATVGSVGTYGLFTCSAGGTVSAGSTVAGSSLEYASVSSGGVVTSGTPSGTWRCMGHRGTSNTVTTVYLRIS